MEDLQLIAMCKHDINQRSCNLKTSTIDKTKDTKVSSIQPWQGAARCIEMNEAER